MFAEILAFMAGLRFWATLIKYMMTINNIGRYYDRMHKIYSFEEEQAKRKMGKDKAKLLSRLQREEAKGARYSHAIEGQYNPYEDILSAKTAHTNGTLGGGGTSRFDIKFAKRVKKNVSTSPMGKMSLAGRGIPVNEGIE